MENRFNRYIKGELDIVDGKLVPVNSTNPDVLEKKNDQQTPACLKNVKEVCHQAIVDLFRKVGISCMNSTIKVLLV